MACETKRELERMKLKPCPFCGGKAEISEGAIYCTFCEISFSNEREKGAEAIKEMVELWNARPIEDALQKELDEAREDNADNMEYHVAERKRLKKEIEELRGCVAFAERMRILELLKSCCNEFVPLDKRTSPNYPVCYRNRLIIDKDRKCTARDKCPIYAELMKGEENDA